MKITSLIKTTALTAICLLLVIPIIIYGFPLLIGADSSYTVMSGSMSPALRPGDLVIVKGEEPVNVGDVVTVESGEFTYTHRVVEKLGGDLFRLKGDANEDPDPDLVEASQIIGRVILVFPFSYLYTSYGFALALLAPAALIIGKQVYTIHQSTKRRNRMETMRWRRKSHSALDTGILLLALILTVSTTRIIAPHFISGSSSYFSDTERGLGLFSAGTWKVSSEIKCLVSKSEITIGQIVSISGSIDPPRSALVTIRFSTDDGSTWTSLTTVTSDVNGSYGYEWKPTVAGSYEIQASWEGDGSYFGASSGVVTVSVGAA
jgi:signal peptidase